MPSPSPTWHLVGFVERLDSWCELEAISDELRRLVTTWIFSRMEDPYQGAKRDSGFDSLWWVQVPNSLHLEDRVVICSYWISEREHKVTCDNFGSLSTPI